RSASLVEQRAVLPLVVLDGAGIAVIELMPEIVHPDQNTEHVGLQIECVRPPARLEIGHLVAADPAIEKLELAIGMGGEGRGADKQRIAAPERAGRVGVLRIAIAAAVGDRIALKQHDRRLLGGGSLPAGRRGQRGTRGDEIPTIHVSTTLSSNGQVRVFFDQIRKQTIPSPNAPSPNPMISNGVVAKMNIQPSSAMRLGSGYSHIR